MRIKWLHLSDIHFNYRNLDSDLLRKDFIDRIAKLSECESFTHLFLSGDILYGNYQSDPKAISFLEQLIASMSLTKQSVFIVPGNHDHDRAVSKAFIEGTNANSLSSAIERMDGKDIQPFLDAFSNYSSCITTFFGKEKSFDFFSPHRFENQNGINIVQLNTAWLDYCSDATRGLLIGTYQLQKLLEANEVLLKHPTALNIAVGHHPLDALAEEEQNKVLDLFSRYNIGLYFCGHLHQPSIDCFKEKDVLQIVCPGGYKDGFSEGGYVWGIIDTDSDFYMAQVFNWNNGSWSIESKLDGTDELGNYYLNTKKFCHKSDIVAIDAKLYDGCIPKQQLDASIGCSNYEIIPCGIPLDNNWAKQESFIQDITQTIKKSVEQGKVVHIFPLAPIPTLIRLGFELQGNTKIIIHQYDRDTDRWVYNSVDDDTKVVLSPMLNGSSELVVVISTSMRILLKDVGRCISIDDKDIVEVVAEPIKLGTPLFSDGVKAVVNQVIEYLNLHQSRYDKIHLFAAIPAGVAVELGRRLLKSIYNNIYLYNYANRSYQQAFVLNPADAGNEFTVNRSQYALPNNVIPFMGSQEVINLPIVGDIACGDISEALENPDGFFPVSRSILSSGAYFILRASGDSMINANIEDGDLILIRQQETADDGEIVVARVGDNTTLKRLFHDKSRKLIVLRSENDAYGDQEYTEVAVQGIAVMVMKQLR